MRGCRRGGGGAAGSADGDAVPEARGRYASSPSSSSPSSSAPRLADAALGLAPSAALGGGDEGGEGDVDGVGDTGGGASLPPPPPSESSAGGVLGVMLPGSSCPSAR
jgi:hypothetical protein